VGDVEQRARALGLQPGVLERDEQVQRRGRVAGVRGEHRGLVAERPVAGPVERGEAAVGATRGGDVDHDRARSEVTAVEQGGGQPGHLVLGHAGAVDQRRATGGSGDREQVSRGQDRLGGSGHDAGEHRVDVVGGDQLGAGRLQDAQLPAQRRQLQIGGPLAGPAEGQAPAAVPVQLVDAGGEAVGLALVVHDLRGGQVEDGGDGGEQPLRVVAIQAGVDVAVVQPETHGGRRGPGLEDLHGRGRRELGHGARQLPDDLPRRAQGTQEQHHRVGQPAVQGG
jgi:hypothetical protein